MNCTSAAQLFIGAASTDPGIERIGTRAFKGCTDLSAVGAIQIVASVRVLGEECFADCENVTSPGVSANFRNGLEVIEEGAFKNCKSLTALLTSNYKGLKMIGAYAFENCDTLKSPTVPVNVTSIGEGCFMNCDSLQYVSFYASLSEYPKDCFKNCPNLSRTGGTAAAFGALKTIGESAYEGCSSLTASASWSIGRYRNLETIGVNAFKGCKSMATGVVVNSDIKAYIYTTQLAASVTSVGANAFDGCTGMGALIFQSEKPPAIGSMSLSSMADDFGIYVLDSKANGDNIYKAYLEALMKVLGEDKAYAVLDSISDGAKDRYKEEMDKAKEPDPASEATTGKKSETDATTGKKSETNTSTEKKSEGSSTEKTTEKDGEKTTETTEKSGETSSEKKETTEKSEESSTSTEKSSESSKSTETTDKKSEESSASKEKTSAAEQKTLSKDAKASTEKIPEKK